MINLFFYVYHKKKPIDRVFALYIVKILLIDELLPNVKSGG